LTGGQGSALKEQPNIAITVQKNLVGNYVIKFSFLVCEQYLCINTRKLKLLNKNV
jgi:hypothetical protein